MRELTALEIDQFDFSGGIPELKKPALRREGRAAAKNQQHANAIKTRAWAKLPRRKHRERIGVAQPA